MSKRNKNNIITETHNKVIIRDGELQKVLTRIELQWFYDIVNKVKDYDNKNKIGSYNE